MSEKTIEIIADHLAHEHTRARNEILIRLELRSRVVKSVFAINAGGIAIFSFLLGKMIEQPDKSNLVLSYSGVISLVFSILLFFGFFLIRDYFTHSAHVYTAAKYITEILSSRYDELLQFSQRDCPDDKKISFGSVHGISNHGMSGSSFRNLFLWEDFLKSARQHYSFQDNFEVRAVFYFSILLFCGDAVGMLAGFAKFYLDQTSVLNLVVTIISTILFICIILGPLKEARNIQREVGRLYGDIGNDGFRLPSSNHLH